MSATIDFGFHGASTIIRHQGVISFGTENVSFYIDQFPSGNLYLSFENEESEHFGDMEGIDTDAYGFDSPEAVRTFLIKEFTEQKPKLEKQDDYLFDEDSYDEDGELKDAVTEAVKKM